MTTAQPETIFDQAQWHFDHNFPEALDRHQAYVYAGMYIGWLIRKELLDKDLATRIASSVHMHNNNLLSAATIYREALNGVFSSRALHPDVVDFTAWYFDGDTGQYPLDYETSVAVGLPSIYHVEDSTGNFEKMFTIIDRTYTAWNTVPPSLQGDWAGEYTYGEGYPEDVSGQTGRFTMTLTDDDGTISGYCMEEIQGIPVTAVITGFIENNFLSFVKTYKDVPLTDQRGDPLPAVPDIHYTGNFLENAFEGTWEIEWKEVDENGAWLEYTTYGTWWMRSSGSVA